jgi:hypothetical protein
VIKMKVTLRNITNEKFFSRLDIGDCFYYDENESVMMKINEAIDATNDATKCLIFNVINLSTGRTYFIDGTHMVRTVSAEIIVNS